MTRQEVLGMETNYRLETTLQDVLAMYMHIYLQGLYYVQSFLKKKREVLSCGTGNVWLDVLFSASRCLIMLV